MDTSVVSSAAFPPGTVWRSVPQLSKGLSTKAMIKAMKESDNERRQSGPEKVASSLPGSRVSGTAAEAAALRPPKKKAFGKIQRAGRKAFAMVETCRPDTHGRNEKLVAYLKTYVYDRSEGQISAMLDIVVKYPFFKKFTEHQKIQLIRMAQYHRVTQGNALFKQDDHPDAVYLVLSGRCAVYKSQGEMRKLLAHLEVFDTVGGLYHLDERQRRAVTAEVSSESAEFVVLDRPTLDALAAEWKAQEEGEKAAFLCEEIPVFNGVQPAVMAGLAPYFEKIQVPKDTVVYRQQEEAVSIFFVWEGELQMLRRFDLQQLSHKHGNTRSPKLGGVGLKIGGDKSMQNNGGGGLAEAPPRKCSKSVPIAVMGRGEFFGEVEVFNDIARTSAVIAMSDCTLLVVQKQTISGDLMPTVLLENLFRYASMRAQFRNSRLDVIHQSLNGIEWHLERDLKLSLEPDLKPLARMRASALPMVGSASNAWLSAHTVMPNDMKEWGLYHCGEWAHRADKQGTKEEKLDTSVQAQTHITSAASHMSAGLLSSSGVPASTPHSLLRSFSAEGSFQHGKISFFLRTTGRAIDKYN